MPLIPRRSFLLAVPGVRSLGARSTLEVAYAGSMASVMEGSIKRAAGDELGLELQGRAQGASGLAQLIASGSIHPDVFISITPGPMETVLKAGKTKHSLPIARTEMVIAYSPTSRFAAQLQRGRQWWSTLQTSGFRFGRTDPVTDPQGRNIIFVMQLASKFYHQPDLARRILGEDLNPRQIFSEPSVQARLQSGELDAASAYKVQPAAFKLPYIVLPKEINLSSPKPATASLVLNGKTYKPEPLVYYAAALSDAGQPFVNWLQGSTAQAIFRQAGYDTV
jgi:molybdate/tungstate transport system substrate-binding protein